MILAQYFVPDLSEERGLQLPTHLQAPRRSQRVWHIPSRQAHHLLGKILQFQKHDRRLQPPASIIRVNGTLLRRHCRVAHILIVDGAAYQRLLLIELLSIDSAITFNEASDGRQALEVARATRPDLVLLDVMMPVIGGFEAGRASHPILLITALRPIPHEAQRRSRSGWFH
jgi:hypothetical protein